MILYHHDLQLADASMFLDALQNRPLSFVSHAHSDHIASHALSIASRETSRLLQGRLGELQVREVAFGVTSLLDDGSPFRLRQAGHVLGSAMLWMQPRCGNGQTLLYTGDFKLRAGLTVPPAEPEPADVLVMESTFGQPMFRFPPARLVIEQLVELVRAALNEGRQPIVMGYSLGKAQEIVRILTSAGLVVTCHGAVETVNRVYRELGVEPGTTRVYRAENFHGATAIDFAERGVLVAPPNVARSGFVTRFEKPMTIMLSGWAMLKNAKFRYGVEHALPLSDHADYDELLRTIEIVQPKKVIGVHGYREFMDDLRDRGIDAEWCVPDRQLRLF